MSPKDILNQFYGKVGFKCDEVLEIEETKLLQRLPMMDNLHTAFVPSVPPVRVGDVLEVADPFLLKVIQVCKRRIYDTDSHGYYRMVITEKIEPEDY